MIGDLATTRQLCLKICQAQIRFLPSTPISNGSFSAVYHRSFFADHPAYEKQGSPSPRMMEGVGSLVN